MNTLREELANYAHEAWVGWMHYLFNKCQYVPGTTTTGWSVLLIPTALMDRWTRQMNTPYADLPEDEKESDRKEAARMMIIAEAYARDLVSPIVRDELARAWAQMGFDEEE